MFLFHLARAFVMPHSHKAPSRADNFSAPPLTTFPLGLGSTAACTWQPTSLARCNFVLKLQLRQKSVNGRQQTLLIVNVLMPRSYFKRAKSCFFYPVLHPFVDEDESKKFRSSGNCRKPALAVGSLAGRLECVASPESKHTKNLPQTDEKRGRYIPLRRSPFFGGEGNQIRHDGYQ